MSAHVDQATVSSMASIVRTLMNVWEPTTANIRALTLLAATHVLLKKKKIRLVCELSIFIDIFK